MDIFETIKNKGIIIAFFTSLTKGVYQLRKKDFSLLVFTTDLLLSMPVGYVWWEMGIKTNINEIMLLITTIIITGNAYSILLIIFNPTTAKKIFGRYIVLVDDNNNTPKKGNTPKQ